MPFHHIIDPRIFSPRVVTSSRLTTYRLTTPARFFSRRLVRKRVNQSEQPPARDVHDWQRFFARGNTFFSLLHGMEPRGFREIEWVSGPHGWKLTRPFWISLLPMVNFRKLSNTQLLYCSARSYVFINGNIVLDLRVSLHAESRIFIVSLSVNFIIFI